MNKDDNVKYVNNILNCKELCLLYELYGEGSKYQYEMFMYIYNDFLKNRELDIFNVFNNTTNDIDIVIYNYRNNKDIMINLYEKQYNFIEYIFKRIDIINNKSFFIIIPTGVDNEDLGRGHAIVIIYEFKSNVLKSAHILNSGDGAINHVLYNSKLMNYVYTIDINYIFDKNNKTENIYIQTYLLRTFFDQIYDIDGIYY